MLLKKEAEDENEVDENGKLIKKNQESTTEVPHESQVKGTVDREKLKDYEYLTSHFYTIDSTTMTSPEELNAETLLAKNMKFTKRTTGRRFLFTTPILRRHLWTRYREMIKLLLWGSETI